MVNTVTATSPTTDPNFDFDLEIAIFNHWPYPDGREPVPRSTREASCDATVEIIALVKFRAANEPAWPLDAVRHVRRRCRQRTTHIPDLGFGHSGVA